MFIVIILVQVDVYTCKLKMNGYIMRFWTNNIYV